MTTDLARELSRVYLAEAHLLRHGCRCGFVGCEDCRELPTAEAARGGEAADGGVGGRGGVVVMEG